MTEHQDNSPSNSRQDDCFHSHYDVLTVYICEGNIPVTGGFPLQRASDIEIWYFFAVNLDNVFLTNNQVGGDLRLHYAYTL